MALPRGSYVGLEATAPLSNDSIAKRIGATNYHDLPPRPKYMRRATYQRPCEEIRDEVLRMHIAYRGKDAIP
jgi:hypothetical protein